MLPEDNQKSSSNSGLAGTAEGAPTPSADLTAIPLIQEIDPPCLSLTEYIAAIQYVRGGPRREQQEADDAARADPALQEATAFLVERLARVLDEAAQHLAALRGKPLDPFAQDIDREMLLWQLMECLTRMRLDSDVREDCLWPWQLTGAHVAAWFAEVNKKL